MKRCRWFRKHKWRTVGLHTRKHGTDSWPVKCERCGATGKRSSGKIVAD